MLPSRKIFMGITGLALIALGVVCISKPLATVISLAWVLGIVTLISGIATFFNWINLKRYLHQSGTILLSAVLQIILGIVFLNNSLAVTAILPIVFAIFLVIEGACLAIRSFDYKAVGFKAWWVNLLLGILAAVLGCLSLTIPGVGGASLSAVVGIGFILVGLVYLFAIYAVNRFEKILW